MSLAEHDLLDAAVVDSNGGIILVHPLITMSFQGQLEGFIADTLQVRLNWLLSGSRVPFGVITEKRLASTTKL